MDHPSSQEERREKHREYCREYHKRTYADRREEKNRKTRERRKRTNWYEAHADELKANRKAYYQAHKEEQRAKGRARHAALRLEVLEHYGVRCACCGETEPKFLGIDHIDNNGAAHRKEIGHSGKAIYYWLRDNNYPGGYQVLCHNCNAAKGHYGTCPHQRDAQ